MTIFFSVGEPSGDLHGANLIRAIRRQRPEAEFVGYGGPRMASAGCRLHEDLTRLAVMWLLRVLLNIHVFYRLVKQAERYFREERPDAVVLIDYPGFNWWIARKAKKHGVPVFYYAPPQIWAWASWRVKKMRRFVDHVLCSLPFEAQWFRQRGCNATFVGHPFFDELEQYEPDQKFLRRMRDDARPLVTILPGSRTQEVTDNLCYFLKAAKLIRDRVPGVRLAVAAFKPHQAQIARRMIAGEGLAIDVYVGKTPELIRAADCCLAVSGSVSLELLYHEKPTVILYWISRAAFFAQRYFRKVKYITLVNLLAADELYPDDLTPFDPAQPDADDVLFPEYLTCRDKSRQIAGHAVMWLTNPRARQSCVDRLAGLKAEVAHGGASQTAAGYIVEVLEGETQATAPPPHFLSEIPDADVEEPTGRSAA
jgi:lipid-A-disaccharide synthase